MQSILSRERCACVSSYLSLSSYRVSLYFFTASSIANDKKSTMTNVQIVPLPPPLFNIVVSKPQEEHNDDNGLLHAQETIIAAASVGDDNQSCDSKRMDNFLLGLPHANHKDDSDHDSITNMIVTGE